MRFDLFSSGRLYTVLKDAEYVDLPAPRTLRDWIQFDSAPEGARVFVADLLGFPSTTKTAAPSMTKRLLAGILALEKHAQLTPEEIASAMHDAEIEEQALLEVDARIAEQLAQSQHKRASQSQGRAGGPKGGKPSNRPRKP